ncbi:MAG: peptidylprolyl isomerase [Pseudomonadota bacterium]
MNRTLIDARSLRISARRKAAPRPSYLSILRFLLLGALASSASLLAHAQDREETPLPNPQVVIKTNLGDVTLRLFRDKAPLTVANFLSYMEQGHYEGTIESSAVWRRRFRQIIEEREEDFRAATAPTRREPGVRRRRVSQRQRILRTMCEENFELHSGGMNERLLLFLTLESAHCGVPSR